MNAQHELVVAMCQRSAEAWARGDLLGATSWFDGALDALDGRDFVDVEGADR
jgi:hypothetical protein